MEKINTERAASKLLLLSFYKDKTPVSLGVSNFFMQIKNQPLRLIFTLSDRKEILLFEIQAFSYLTLPLSILLLYALCC